MRISGNIQKPNNTLIQIFEFIFYFQFIKEYSVLEKFWIRLNRVNLERRILADKKKELHADFMKLTRALRGFMGGMNPQDRDLHSFAPCSSRI